MAFPGRAWERDQFSRRGLTLMELLVVIILLGLITAVTIPIMNPQAAPRRVREGARLVAGFIQTARTRAIAENRSVGIWLEHQPAPLDSACYKLYMAEQPPPYAGESLGSTVSISGGAATFQGINGALINDGDVLQINFQGHLYRIAKSGSSYSLTSPTAPGGKPPDTPTGVSGLPFQVFRQPIRSAEKPIQLPSGIAIDLTASGFQSQPVSGTGPFVVMFLPGGALDAVYNLTNAGSTRAPDTLYLLIGRSDGLIKNNPNDKENNINDPGTIWVSVSNQTGLVSTVENAGDSSGSMQVDAARGYAQSRDSMGGR